MLGGSIASVVGLSHITTSPSSHRAQTHICFEMHTDLLLCTYNAYMMDLVLFNIYLYVQQLPNLIYAHAI